MTAQSQGRPESGFVFRIAEIGENNSQIFFVAAEVDTTMSLEENLMQLENDTLVRINFRDAEIYNFSSIKNDGKIIHVLPVRVVWDNWSLEDSFLHSGNFTAFTIKAANRTIVHGYNPKLIRSFKSFAIVKLPGYKDSLE